MSSRPPKTVSPKGKRSKTKARKTVEVGSSSSKLPVQRVQIATECTRPLDPSFATSGGVGFARHFESVVDRNYFFNKYFNRRKV
jgi:hypothetical protein